MTDSDCGPVGRRSRRGVARGPPRRPYAAKLDLFGRFIGFWRLEWTGAGTDRQPATMTGELYFG